MSSNELFGNLNYVDLPALVSGALPATTYTLPNVNVVGDFNSSSQIVGVSLKTAGADVASGSNNASNVIALIQYEIVANAAAGGAVKQTLTLSGGNLENKTDQGVYRVYFVNNNLPNGKVVNGSQVYPC